MQKEILESFNLPNVLSISNIETKEKEIHVKCKTKKRKLRCPRCDSSKTGGYDFVPNKKSHTILNGKKVILFITKRRLECRACHRVFTEKIAGLEGYKSTAYFTQMIQEKSRNSDYSSVAREMHVSPSTVLNKQELLPLQKFIVPEEKELYLGLDGKYLNSEDEIFVVGEVKLKKFIGVTMDNSSKKLQALLKKHIRDKGKIVKAITMDMSKTLKSIASSVFPEADIIVDKFHTVKYTNSVIDLCRVATEKHVHEKFEIKRILLMNEALIRKLSKKEKWAKKIARFKELLKTHEELRILRDLKIRVHAFYECERLETAEKSFEGILGFLDANVNIHPEFKDLKKTLLNWRKEILAYFTYRLTNAFIEGLNNRIETLKRKKFGFRSKLRFVKSISLALFPITLFLTNLIFTHY